MVTCKQISTYFEKIAPLALAEEWDNPGLLLGGLYDEIKKIMVCLDVTSEVVEEAVHKNVHLIISHHPIIFKPLTKVIKDDFKGKILYELIKNDIAVYSAHTNLDIANEGLNEYLASILGLSEIRDLNFYKSFHYEEFASNEIVIFNDETSSNDMIADDITALNKKEHEYGLGKVGMINPSCTFSEFLKRLKEALGVEYVRVIGNVPVRIQKAAVFCGGFDGNRSGLFRERPDVLVTGDIKHNEAIDLTEIGFCVIDAGHYSTEIIVKDLMVKLIEKEFKTIEIFKSKWEKNPVRFA